MPDSMQIKEIVAKYRRMKTPLIYILKDVQKASGYLSKEILTRVAIETQIPLSTIYGIATFYSLFNIKQKGNYIVRLCSNAPCHVKQASAVLDRVKEFLRVGENETTSDGNFTLELTSCLGLCAVAPVMMVNDAVYGNLTPERAVAILQDYKLKGSSNA